MKKISLIGSTGSIGVSTLNVCRHLKEKVQVVALAAKSSIDLLEQQAKEFHPEVIAVYEEDKARELQKRLPGIEVLSGMEGIIAVASYSSANFVVSAMTGTLGLLPTMKAIESGKNVGLANKEALVSGGALVMDAVKKHGVKLLPIDSEHSALFQCLNGENLKAVRRLILTASGGPFRNFTKEQLRNVDVSLALKHPTWQMGPKITIDSSTLMNKGLEVIEAHYLFSQPLDQIDVVIHPQSIIHSMVEFVDGSIIAQMGEPQMITPIQYALTYPERAPGLLPTFDFVKAHTLQFFKPDCDSFRCLQLAFDALRAGGSMACYMNAANEVLVHRCLRKEIGWFDIGEYLSNLMERHVCQKLNSIDDVLYIDRLARDDASTQPR